MLAATLLESGNHFTQSANNLARFQSGDYQRVAVQTDYWVK